MCVCVCVCAREAHPLLQEDVEGQQSEELEIKGHGASMDVLWIQESLIVTSFINLTLYIWMNADLLSNIFILSKKKYHQVLKPGPGVQSPVPLCPLTAHKSPKST